MQIRFTTCMAGHDFTRNVGDVAELPDAEAQRLVEAGFAVPHKAGAAVPNKKQRKKAQQLETATEPTDLETTSLDVSPKV